MKQLLSIELIKLKRLNALKYIFLAYAILIPSWMFIVVNFINGHPNLRIIFPSAEQFCSFPEVWNYTMWSASCFNVLMGVSVVIITCNEIQFRTQKQNVIDGLSKRQLIFSKFLVIFIISTMVTLYTTLVTVITGMIYSGTNEMYTHSHSIFLYYLQTLGYFSLAYLVASLLQKPAVSIIVFVIIFPLETIIGAFIPKGYYDFFPLNILSNLTPFPFARIARALEKKEGMDIWHMPMWMIILLATIIIAATFIGSYLLLRKRDL